VLGRYRGRTVVLAASGPSLTGWDLDQVRASGLPLVVVNNTWQLAPWADMLVAMDTAWWRGYGERAAAEFAGLRVGFTATCTKFGAQATVYGHVVSNFGNSGAASIAVAVRARAARVLLLGFDASFDAGRMHWHEDHPKPMSNPQASVGRWPVQFGRVAEHARKGGVEVINCSRRTVLECFPRAELEEALRSALSSGCSTSATSGGATPSPPPSASATPAAASPAA
jgi:hypothetical protein